MPQSQKSDALLLGGPERGKTVSRAAPQGRGQHKEDRKGFQTCLGVVTLRAVEGVAAGRAYAVVRLLILKHFLVDQLCNTGSTHGQVRARQDEKERAGNAPFHCSTVCSRSSTEWS